MLRKHQLFSFDQPDNFLIFRYDEPDHSLFSLNPNQYYGYDKVKIVAFDSEWHCVADLDSTSNTIPEDIYLTICSLIPGFVKKIRIKPSSPLFSIHNCEEPNNNKYWLREKYFNHNFKEREDVNAKSSVFTKMIPEKIFLPLNITSIHYLKEPGWNNIEEESDFLRRLPEHVDTVEYNHLFSSRYSKEDLNKLFTPIPHVKTIITTAYHDEDPLYEEKLHHSLINLPFSIEQVDVKYPNKFKNINMQEFRQKNVFRKSYNDFLTNDIIYLNNDEPDDLHIRRMVLFQEAIAILTDYTKRDSFFGGGLTLLFTHWRHHVPAVNELLDTLNAESTFDDLYLKLAKIRDDSIAKNEFNPTGSLARRIRYIEYLAYQKNIPLPNNVEQNHLKLRQI